MDGELADENFAWYGNQERVDLPPGTEMPSRSKFPTGTQKFIVPKDSGDNRAQKKDLWRIRNTGGGNASDRRKMICNSDQLNAVGFKCPYEVCVHTRWLARL